MSLLCNSCLQPLVRGQVVAHFYKGRVGLLGHAAHFSALPIGVAIGESMGTVAK